MKEEPTAASLDSSEASPSKPSPAEQLRADDALELSKAEPDAAEPGKKPSVVPAVGEGSEPEPQSEPQSENAAAADAVVSDPVSNAVGDPVSTTVSDAGEAEVGASSAGKVASDEVVSDGAASGEADADQNVTGESETDDGPPDSGVGGPRVQLDSGDLQLVAIEPNSEPNSKLNSKANGNSLSEPSLAGGESAVVSGASGGPVHGLTEEPVKEREARTSDAVTAAVADALQMENPLTASERPRSSPPPPPSRRRSDQVAAPMTGAGAISISPISSPGGASLPPVELRRVLPARSIRGRALPGGQSGASQTLVQPNRIIEVLGSSTPAFSERWADEVEDLDENEAFELSDTPLPEALTDEFVVEVDDSSPGASPGAAAPAAVAPVAATPPKKKRRRPPAPAASKGSAGKGASVFGAGEGSARKPWWEEMFSQDFLRAIPILLPRQLNREVDFIESQLSVVPGGRVLDLACGAGQHAVELASRGYEVVGFDSSQAQLDWAGELALERMQKLQFINGDMRTLTYQEAFDGINCWNTSFGYFEEEKNLEVIQRIYAALRPGGRLLLDVVNRDFVVAQQPGQTWFEGDGCVCIDDVTIDFITSRMRIKRTMMLTSGKNLECNYSLRLYGLHELGKILHSVGFKVSQVSGRPETPGVFFGDTSPRLMILASKPND